MDVILPKCNGCGAVNSANQTGWIRIFGCAVGAQRGPIQPTKWIDFCPGCAAKTTVDKLPAVAVVKPA